MTPFALYSPDAPLRVYGISTCCPRVQFRRGTDRNTLCFWPPSPISPPCALLTTNAVGNAKKVWFASVTTRVVTNVSAQRKNDVQT